MISDRIERFRRGNLTFEVIDSGPIDGTPVVLLHGFPQRGQRLERRGGSTTRRRPADVRTGPAGVLPRCPAALPVRLQSQKQLVADTVALIDEIGTPVTSGGARLGRGDRLGDGVATPRTRRIAHGGQRRTSARLFSRIHAHQRPGATVVFHGGLPDPVRSRNVLLSKNAVRGAKAGAPTPWGCPKSRWTGSAARSSATARCEAVINWYRSLPLAERQRTSRRSRCRRPLCGVMTTQCSGGRWLSTPPNYVTAPIRTGRTVRFTLAAGGAAGRP